MQRSILLIKIVHTAIFFVLSASVLYTFYSGITGNISVWTWIAMLFVLGEGAVLLVTGWQCPLTVWAEKLGSPNGAVADVYLPKWFSDRLFPICGATMAVAVLFVLFRWLVD